MLQLDLKNSSYKRTFYFDGEKKKIVTGYTDYRIARYETSDGAFFTGPAIDSIVGYTTLQKYAKTKLGIIMNSRDLKRGNPSEENVISLLKKEESEEYYVGIVAQVPDPTTNKIPDMYVPVWNKPVWRDMATGITVDFNGVNYKPCLLLFTEKEFNEMSKLTDLVGDSDSFNDLKVYLNRLCARIFINGDCFENKWLVLNDCVPMGMSSNSGGTFYSSSRFTCLKGFSALRTISSETEDKIVDTLACIIKSGEEMDRNMLFSRITEYVKESSTQVCYETQIAGYGLNSVDILDLATAQPVNLKEAFYDFYNEHMLNDYSEFIKADEYTWCPSCGMYHKNNWLININGKRYCPLELHAKTYVCSHCKDLFVSECSLDGCNSRYCKKCVNSVDNSQFMGVRGYHDSPSIVYYDYDKNKNENFIDNDTDRDNFKGYGIELEIGGQGEQNSESEKVIKLLKNEVYCMHDGSICNSSTARSAGGFEIITFPHTEDALYNMKWKNTMNYLLKRGYKSHDIKTCGLHMHFSRTLFNGRESIIKMMYFYDRFYGDVCNFARRNKSKATQWADKYASTSPKNISKSALYDILSNSYGRYNMSGVHGMRYRAVNIINSNTVEVRIMRGTLDYNTFLVTLDFLITIQKNANKISYDDLDDIGKWLEGMKPETLEYITKNRCFTSHKRIPALTEGAWKAEGEVDWSYTEDSGDGFSYELKMIGGKPMRCIKNIKTGEIMIKELGGIID